MAPLVLERLHDRVLYAFDADHHGMRKRHGCLQTVCGRARGALVCPAMAGSDAETTCRANDADHGRRRYVRGTNPPFPINPACERRHNAPIFFFSHGHDAAVFMEFWIPRSALP